MSTNVPTTFKITSVKSGETRRFPATNSFAELKKCLSSFWGEHPFILTYLDEDADVISVSTEFEFNEALSVAKDLGTKVFKLNAFFSEAELRAHTKPEKEAEQTPETNKMDTPIFTFLRRGHQVPTPTHRDPVHRGVVCDRSGMNPIVGPRYHVPGADYDLCSAEFEKLPETERVLYVKIEAPGSRPVPCDPHFKHAPSFFAGGSSCPRNRCPRRGGCPGRFVPPQSAPGDIPPFLSVEDLMVQASLAASIFEDLQRGGSRDGTNQGGPHVSPFAEVLSSFVDAAGAAAVAAATASTKNKNKEDPNKAQEKGTSQEAPQRCHEGNPLADLLSGIRREFVNNKRNPSGGGGTPCQSQCNIEEKVRAKVCEHFQKLSEQSSTEGNPLASHPLCALFSALAAGGPGVPSHGHGFKKPAGGGGGGGAAVSEGPAIHSGVECDKSGMNPILGIRYTIPFANYDLCEAEFEKLPESERVLYSKILTPGDKPIRCLVVETAASSSDETPGDSSDESNGSDDSNAWTKVDKQSSLSAEEPEEEALPQPPVVKIVNVTPKTTTKTEVPVSDASPKLTSDDVAVKTSDTVKPAVTVGNEPSIDDEKFAQQLEELANMGFIDRDLNLTLLKRYQGRIDRVVNYVLENNAQLLF